MHNHTLPVASVVGRASVLALTLALGVSSCSASTDVVSVGTPNAESAPLAPSDDSTPDLASADGSPPETVSDEVPTDWALPIDTAVEKIAGYSRNAIVTAVNDARFDYIVNCMTAQGWEFDLSDLPPAATTEEERQTRTVANQSAYYLSLIDDKESESSSESPAAKPQAPSGLIEDENNCWMQAAIEFPNPIDSLWSWLATEMEDLNHKVGQDDRYVSAQADARACIAAEGYDFRTSDEGFNYFVDMANAVWVRYQSGDIDEDAARAELQDLSVKESEFVETEFACSKEIGRVGFLVRSEYEEQFLAENGDRVALAATEYAEKLEPLREFLLARKEG